MRVLLCALALTAALASPAIAGPEEDALQVVQQWAAAFNASDVDAIVALYAPDAISRDSIPQPRYAMARRSRLPAG